MLKVDLLEVPLMTRGACIYASLDLFANRIINKQGNDCRWQRNKRFFTSKKQACSQERRLVDQSLLKFSAVFEKILASPLVKTKLLIFLVQTNRHAFNLFKLKPAISIAFLSLSSHPKPPGWDFLPRFSRNKTASAAQNIIFMTHTNPKLLLKIPEKI